MSVRSFLDTNILVYADDGGSPAKQSKAVVIVEQAFLEGTGVLSTQVLQEYFATVTRKLGVPPDLARRKVEILSRLDLVLVDLPILLSAIDLHRLHQLSIWDALVIRSALKANCGILFTEDLQHGWRIEGLQVVNPFLPAGREERR